VSPTYTHRPLRAQRFLAAAMDHLAPLEGTFIHGPITRDYRLKTEQEDGGYGRWLTALFAHFKQRYGLADPEVLDFGCGTGELSVLMRSLGLRVTGIDVHEKHLELARLLATENGFDPAMFRLNDSPRLPFSDKSFDVITLFVVIEHLDDALLLKLLPEFRRVCRGVVFVLAPNKLRMEDEHTGLKLVPWLPRTLASVYVRLRGKTRRYAISADERWDVHFRTLGKIMQLFNAHGFRADFPPDELVFPPLGVAPPIHRIGKALRFGGRSLFIGVSLPMRWLLRRWPRQAFYPHLNVIFQPERPAP
jgi:2-polyprenyl-3-methyl-5-hydroxy-6-metoxy-1,4-benzoquinol methylase